MRACVRVFVCVCVFVLVCVCNNNINNVNTSVIKNFIKINILLSCNFTALRRLTCAIVYDWCRPE